MGQLTFSDMEYSRRKKSTRRDRFLETMNDLVPWEEWVSAIEPYYPQGLRGRPPVGIEKMLRMYLLQNWFHLSAAAVEDTIYDSYAMRKFMGIDFLEDSVPDATTLLKFRHLLEKNGLNGQFAVELRRRLAEHGQILKPGTLTDAALVRVVPSTGKKTQKSQDGAPEVVQLEMA